MKTVARISLQEKDKKAQTPVIDLWYYPTQEELSMARLCGRGSSRPRCQVRKFSSALSGPVVGSAAPTVFAFPAFAACRRLKSPFLSPFAGQNQTDDVHIRPREPSPRPKGSALHHRSRLAHPHEAGQGRM